MLSYWYNALPTVKFDLKSIQTQVKTTLWKTLFGKEADKLEHANDDERTYYIIEKEPIVNTFISVPKVQPKFFSFSTCLSKYVNDYPLGQGQSQLRRFCSRYCWSSAWWSQFSCEGSVWSKWIRILRLLFQVSAHWHKGTTFMVKFEEEVIARDRAAE